MKPWLAGLIGVAVLTVATEALVHWGVVSQLVIAKPSDVGAAVLVLIREEGLFGAFLTTLAVTGAATGLAIGIGVPAGYALYRHRAFGEAYESWLGALFAAPLIMLYPLFLVIFGRGHLTIIVMGTITGVIPIILSVRQGLVSVPRTLNNVGRVFGCTVSQQFWKIQLPAATPTIFTGMRLGIIYALVNIIGIEFLITFGGLGRIVSENFDRFNIPGMYAAILFIIIVSTLFLWVLTRAEIWVRAVR